ncbi:hypothetical protein SVIOM342S_06699 [Streptomyces violaceorubidus]
MASKVGYDGIQPSRADWATRSAVCSPARVPGAVGDARASAAWDSYRHWPECRYQYGVPAICREGLTQSAAEDSCCQPVYGRTFSWPT